MIGGLQYPTIAEYVAIAGYALIAGQVPITAQGGATRDSTGVTRGTECWRATGTLAPAVHD
jgi:hypothetical protein